MNLNLNGIIPAGPVTERIEPEKAIGALCQIMEGMQVSINQLVDVATQQKAELAALKQEVSRLKAMGGPAARHSLIRG